MKKPLAHRLRPTKLSEIVGQKHLVGEGQILNKFIKNQTLPSMILFGNPGTGKTTLASVLAQELNVQYRLFNAVIGNKKDLVTLFEEAKIYGEMVVIIEEIHRLNKDKQDLLLPHIEDGTITIIGTTTANPYFAINPAIRSRCHLFEVKPVENQEIAEALMKVVEKVDIIGKEVVLEHDAAQMIADQSNGDMRYAINLLELCIVAADNQSITREMVKTYAPMVNMSMDANDDGHYDAVSAFQKSIRGSDVDAALYYLGRLILANDMDSIERRLLATAYEDIGLGNPAAVARTVAAIDAAKRIGFPEAKLPLSVAVIDLTLSPKSKSGEMAIDKVLNQLQQQPHDVPKYLRLTPVGLNEADKYPYDRPDIWHKIQYLPEAIKGQSFYQPVLTSEYEKALAKNYQRLKSIRREAKISKLK